jgi:hypothetical protein
MRRSYKRQRVPLRSPSSHRCMIHHLGPAVFLASVANRGQSNTTSLLRIPSPRSVQRVCNHPPPYQFSPAVSDHLLSYGGRPDREWHRRRRATSGRRPRIIERLGRGRSCSEKTIIVLFPPLPSKKPRNRPVPAPGHREKLCRDCLARVPSKDSNRSFEIGSSPFNQTMMSGGRYRSIDDGTLPVETRRLLRRTRG